MHPLTCTQCGAPHNGHRCEYCGTRYSADATAADLAAAIWDTPFPQYQAYYVAAGAQRPEWLQPYPPGTVGHELAKRVPSGNPFEAIRLAKERL